jgi:carboxylate-amine ligase
MADGAGTSAGGARRARSSSKGDPAVPDDRNSTSLDATEPGRSLGVEEEFLVVDPESRRVVPRAAAVLAAAAGQPGRAEKELTQIQVETATAPCRTLDALRADLVRARAAIAAAAGEAGCAVAPSGTAVLAGASHPPISDSNRYGRMAAEYRALLSGQGVCGCHVHVGVPDRETALQVSNHVRPWLPALQALAGNSPFLDGVDTGYASWRSVAWSRWPVGGPPPFWHSVEQYDALVESLISSGVILDPGMVYWYARPSARFPTLEIRVCDVLPTVDDVLLVAALTRALVQTALTDLGRGLPAVEVPEQMLRAAHWRAARDGLEGEAVNVVSGQPLPAWDLVGHLLAHVGPALDRSGDAGTVTGLVAGLRERGSAAARQRAVYEAGRNPADVVDWLVGQLRAGPDPVPAGPTGGRMPQG